MPGDNRGPMDDVCRKELPDASPSEYEEERKDSPMKSVRFQDDSGKPGTVPLNYDRIEIPSGI